ncbi:hypothetical protein [Frankia sp. Cas3]|uniref:hypothetical protein n=1 Tax=Frankia sp. Cas3 TaxID=3073926 RepID=UPI002AD497B2|nr:hypothetical protein [Frankia sp. Cas3]
MVCSSHALPPRAQADQWPLPPPERIWAAWDTARATIDDFDPDLVVIFSGDHRRTFRDVIPTLWAFAPTGRRRRATVSYRYICCGG